MRLLLLLLFFSCSFLQAQNEYFLHNPAWKMSRSCGTNYPCTEATNYNYYINGDTLINSLLYKKVFEKGISNYSWATSPPIDSSCNTTSPVQYINAAPSFFVRSAGKLVFLRKPNLSNEQLLYDFNLQVGDTLPLTANNNISDITVTAIDSFSTPYGFRKRFHLWSNMYPPPTYIADYLIEGVCFTKGGLVEYMMGSNMCYGSLLCYSINDTTYYPYGNPQAACNMNVSSGPDLKKDAPVLLYPNPVSDLLHISLPGNTISSCSICDFTGNIISMRSGSAALDVSDLAAGFYILEIRTAKGAVARKTFVKT